jgi:C-terminal processing protease CtpA/Prc
MKKYFLFFLLLGLLFTTCKKGDDLVVNPINEDTTEEPKEEPKEEVNIIVQNFMWQTMNAYYLWQGDVPDLADNRFATLGEYEEFLAATPSPSDFFEKKLLHIDDRFSGYRENYKDLTNLLAGITKSNGLEFGLSLYGTGSDVFGFVQYIVSNSDASTKEIARGDIFVGVNGTSLNRDNYINLLFENQDTYTLNMADIIDNTIVPNDKEVTLTKEDGLVEDPLLLSKVLEIGGQKIGYVMFNQFTGGSGEDLNTAFGELKSAGVTDLVLDLRYNLGGKGYTASILASLIYGSNTDDIFFKIRYNEKVQATLEPSDVEDYFVDTTGSAFGNMNTALNSLNLNRVYILATDSSASASELVMNGLVPYLEVVHIGTTTVGKNQGSFTFVDDFENGNFYDPDREDKINPDNQWGLQPIVSTVENAAGFSDYADGLLPDIELEEDIANLGILGDINEPLLARAIQEITGISAKRGFNVQIPVNLVTSSKMANALNSNLILDKVPTSLQMKFKSEME